MMRTRAAASAGSAAAPAPGALTVQVSAQSDNLPQRNGLQSAAVATNLIEVGKPEHQGVASARAGTALHATPVAAETVPPSPAVAEHVQAQYLLGEVDMSPLRHMWRLIL